MYTPGKCQCSYFYSFIGIMHESQLTSYMVYNYLKQRQIGDSCPPLNQSVRQSKLNLVMEYEQYVPQRKPRLGHSSMRRSKHRSYQTTNKKRQQSKCMQEKLKKINDLPVEFMSLATNQEKIKYRRVCLGADFDDQEHSFHRSKIECREHASMPNKIQGLSSTQNSFIQKVNEKRQKTRRSNKYSFNTKFGLDIRQIKRMSQALQRQKNRMKQKKVEYSPVAQKQKLQRSTIGPTYSLESKPLNLDSLQEKFSLEDSQQIVRLRNNLSSLKSKKKMFSLKEKRFEDERSIQARLQKMLNQLSTILYSYGCFMRPLEQQSQIKIKVNKKKGAKYTYYVGKGNNKNLIISILKKRWWWVQSQDINSADFVWTQIKVHSIMQNQPSMRYSELALPDPELYRNTSSDKSHKEQTVQEQSQKLFHPQLKHKFYQKMTFEEQKRILRELKPPTVLHNHYEANYMIGNKKALFHNLVSYYNYMKKDVFQIIPLTYHVQKTNSKSWKLFQKQAKNMKNTYWIVKPGENSNRGKGIFVANSVLKVKNRMESTKNKNQTFIIQKYIKNLFLFQKRKFDIRTYMLMVSIGGVMKFYWYSEGYIRTSSEVFDLSDIEDPFIHLTNDAVQVKNANYGKFEAGNKISYHQFQRYLDFNYPQQKFCIRQLSDKMKNIALQVVKATYFKLDPPQKEESFELFGMDFIIDSNFRPWLLQTNTNPCLELSAPCLERLIPRVLQNAFRIAVDPVFQPTLDCPRSFMSYIPDNLLLTNRFELMFDSLFDRDLEWEQFASQLKESIQYEDEDEQFQGDGEIIAIDF